MCTCFFFVIAMYCLTCTKQQNSCQYREQINFFMFANNKIPFVSNNKRFVRRSNLAVFGSYEKPHLISVPSWEGPGSNMTKRTTLHRSQFRSLLSFLLLLLYSEQSLEIVLSSPITLLFLSLLKQKGEKGWCPELYWEVVELHGPVFSNHCDCHGLFGKEEEKLDRKSSTKKNYAR